MASFELPVNYYCVSVNTIRGGQTSFGSHTLGGNCGDNRVFIHQFKRTVATLLSACENIARLFLSNMRTTA